jgi:hypothetical protein
MFVNLETCDFREAMAAVGETEWRAIAGGFLKRNERPVAIGKIADALQFFARDQGTPKEMLHASLYAIALQRIDFYTLALELVQLAEVADPTLVKKALTDIGELDDEPLAA